MGKLSQGEFLERLRERNSHYADGEFEVLGGYAGISTPLRCRCLVCGNVWDGNPDSMLWRNSRCPKCGRAAAGKNSGESRTLTHEAFVGRAADACPDVEVVGRYAGANTRLAARRLNAWLRYLHGPFGARAAGASLSGSWTTYQLFP